MKNKKNRDIEIRNLKANDIKPLIGLHLSLDAGERSSYRPCSFTCFGVFCFVTIIYFSSSVRILKKFAYPQTNYLALVAIDNRTKDYAGFCFLQQDKKTEKSVAELGIVVTKNFRNQGVAYSMIKELIKLAYDNKIEKIKLGVMLKNTAAIHLYKKIGFSIISKKDYYYDGKRYDMLTMSFAIPSM